MELVGQSQCYVIDAISKRGKYTLWIDPEHGHNIAKAEVFRDPRECVATIGERAKGMTRSMYCSIRNVRFKKIEDIWVPVEADTQRRSENTAGSVLLQEIHLKRTEVILNPDHEALRSFYPDDIPPEVEIMGFDSDGSPPERAGVQDLGFEDAWDFRWQPKAKYVVDERLKLVRNDPQKQMPTVVKVLKLMHFVGDFKPEPPITKAKGKHIVLCFWDINQEQSQQLLLTLRDRQQALAQKGILLIAVEASGVQTDKVRSWARDNELTFPVGAFHSRFEQYWKARKKDMDDRKKKTVLSNLVTDIKTIWTVEKLPWLMLSDRDLVVTAEGFDLDELNEILPDEVPFEKSTSKPQSLSEPNEAVKASLKLLSDNLQESLVLYYSFDESEKVIDLSGNGNHGRIHGAKYTQERGGAMKFDGQDDYISVEDIELKEYSFSTWVKTSKSNVVSSRYIFVSDDWVHRHALQGNSGHSLSIVADSSEINEYEWPFAANTWTHLVLTHLKGTFKLYKNGKSIKTGKMESYPVTDTLYLGGKEKDSKRSWLGMIDEVAVFDRALTEDEVKILYNNSRKNK
jgi:hypothetical protein